MLAISHVLKHFTVVNVLNESFSGDSVHTCKVENSPEFGLEGVFLKHSLLQCYSISCLNQDHLLDD